MHYTPWLAFILYTCEESSKKDENSNSKCLTYARKKYTYVRHFNQFSLFFLILEIEPSTPVKVVVVVVVIKQQQDRKPVEHVILGGRVVAAFYSKFLGLQFSWKQGIYRDKMSAEKDWMN